MSNVSFDRAVRKDGTTGLFGTFEGVKLYWAALDKPKQGSYQGVPSTPRYEVTIFLTESAYEQLAEHSATYFGKVEVLSGNDWDKASNFSDEDFEKPVNKKYKPLRPYLKDGKPFPEQDDQYKLTLFKNSVNKKGEEVKKPDVTEYFGKDKFGVDVWKRIPEGVKVGNGSVADIDIFGWVDSNGIDHIYLGGVFVTELVEYIAPEGSAPVNKRGRIIESDDDTVERGEEVDEASEAIAPVAKPATAKAPATRKKAAF